ncbi:MAG: hypothetical protein A3F11_11575 [Gammaproteobacteria bacterium RIFCSPHIGHO2_12_FULL_37_14]|nr:MAG: hypothetical protein A3F11_11575 [Gammaproteobacteria bacterium RIFCSPHIGHO2_12_FULL_37_14]
MLNDFLSEWLSDEINHAHAFQILYHHIYHESQDSISQRLVSRQTNFSMIDEFFSDLPSTCLLLAYDELITTHVYHQSIDFYDKLGSTMFSEFIRRLKYDEAKHYFGIISIVKDQFSGKRALAESLLNKIIQVDDAMDDYYGTFVLDHACPEFPLSKSNIMMLCEKIILRKID